mmetsp:Transcript_34526/g.75488  ORF Transcript_34526/g.75488 Transcript_34526/m.75488 type:complete len:299 (-) Transcript_34526:282-1178(-)
MSALCRRLLQRGTRLNLIPRLTAHLPMCSSDDASQQVYQPTNGRSIFTRETCTSFDVSVGSSFLQPLTRFHGSILLPNGARAYAKGKKGKKEKSSQKAKDSDDESEDDGPAVQAPEFDLDAIKEKMDKNLEAYYRELSQLRTGRASPGLLDSIKVEAYGEVMPLNQLGLVTVRSPQLLAVSLYDPSTASAVEKAIHQSPLGLNPRAEVDGILVPIPSLSAEGRKEVAKLAAAAANSAKVAIRTRRKEAMDLLKERKKLGTSEDQVAKDEKKVQLLTDQNIAEIDKVAKAKHEELMALV